MSAHVVSAAVEGEIDAAVVRRVISTVGLKIGSIFGRKGKGHLDLRLAGYNNAARHGYWLVLRDLDHDASCPAELVQRLLPNPFRRMCFRIAVRQVEAWLLADRPGIASWLHLPIEGIPMSPDALEDAKAAVIALARRSRYRDLREEMVPAPMTSAKVGPGYTGRMVEFAAGPWHPRRAALFSPSLASCLRSLGRWRSSP